MSEWCDAHPDVEVFGQVGPSVVSPRFPSSKFLSPAEMERRLEEASVVVAHAGMGTILSCLTKNKPLIVMPRLADLGEHRNNHQVATAEKLRVRLGLNIANQKSDLHRFLDNDPKMLRRTEISRYASESFCNEVAKLIG